MRISQAADLLPVVLVRHIILFPVLKGQLHSLDMERILLYTLYLFAVIQRLNCAIYNFARAFGGNNYAERFYLFGLIFIVRPNAVR